MQVSLLKNIAFNEENEVRLAYLNNTSNIVGERNHIPVEYRTTESGRIIPYVDIRIDNNNKCPISSVYLGPKNDNKSNDLEHLFRQLQIDLHRGVHNSEATYR